MFASSPNTKRIIKLEAAGNPRVVEGQEDFDEDAEDMAGSNFKTYDNRGVTTLNSGSVTYKLISPASGGGSGVGNNVQTTVLTAAPMGGGQQFYVIGNPSDVVTGPGGGRVLAPKAATTLTLPNTSVVTASSIMSEGPGGSRRIDRRRATHNEVERRRRDTINAWIMTLGKLIPGLDLEDQEKGPPKGGALSKGGILAKACDYVTELTADNKSLEKRVHDLEVVAEEHDRLLSAIEELRQENAIMKQQLENHGIATPNMEDILDTS